MTSPSTFILISAYVGSVIFVILVTWLFRRISSQPREPLNRLTRAYLVGGPRRALEVAFFQLATEGWIKPSAEGEFVPRVYSVGEDVAGLLPLEREMLEWAAKQIKFSQGKILNRQYGSLVDIEKQLIRSRLILSTREFTESQVISLLPLGLLSAYCMAHALMNVQLHIRDPRWMVVSALGVATLLYFVNHSRRSTSLGMIQRSMVIRESRMRIHQSRQSATDGNPSTYDLLWKMSDQVLLGGLRALGGTFFAKPGNLDTDDSKTTVI